MQTEQPGGRNARAWPKRQAATPRATKEARMIKEVDVSVGLAGDGGE